MNMPSKCGIFTLDLEFYIQRITAFLLCFKHKFKLLDIKIIFFPRNLESLHAMLDNISKAKCEGKLKQNHQWLGPFMPCVAIFLTVFIQTDFENAC